MRKTKKNTEYAEALSSIAEKSVGLAIKVGELVLED